jgi:hypothetical protein
VTLSADPVRVQFHATVGRLIVRTVERELRFGALDAGVDLQLERLPGLLEVGLVATVNGPRSDVRRYLRAVQRWAGEIDSGLGDR